MSSTKKENNYHFGMKSHIGIDAESGVLDCDPFFDNFS
jgi:IS5 family transposase